MDILSSDTVYEYALRRPLDDGGAPPGYVGHRPVRKTFTWRYRHGVAQYKNPLPKNVINRYKLVPLTPTDPTNVAMALDHLYDDIVHFLIRKKNYTIERAGGGVFEVGLDLAPPHIWYVHEMDRAGNTVDYVLIDRIPNIARHLWRGTTPEKRESFLGVFNTNL